MKRSVMSILLVLALCVCLASCASLKAAWQGLTPDQKARVVLDELQTQLDQNFDLAKNYVDAHPEYAEVWKAEVVPTFDLANKALKDVMDLAQKGEITPEEVRSRVMPFVNKVVTYLVLMGVLE